MCRTSTMSRYALKIAMVRYAVAWCRAVGCLVWVPGGRGVLDGVGVAEAAGRSAGRSAGLPWCHRRGRARGAAVLLRGGEWRSVHLSAVRAAGAVAGRV